MPLKVALADYGVGNLHSIRKALENCGAIVNVIEDMSLLTEAECIVLPGVGAFDKTMERLLPYKEDIVQRLNEGVPCLGICIGMQIMFQNSAEGEGPGLGIPAWKGGQIESPAHTAHGLEHRGDGRRDK